MAPYLDVQKRVIYGFLMASTSLGCVISGGIAFYVLLSLVLAVAGIEWYVLCDRIESEAYLSYSDKIDKYIDKYTILSSRDFKRRVRLISTLGYCVLLSFGLGLMALPTSDIITVFCITWSTDIMAYVGGTLLKGPLLLKSISPQKTISGLVVGIFFGALAGHFRDIYWPMALCVSCFAQLGDLLESTVKRMAHVKDSNITWYTNIPGHGGILDRIDALVWALPSFWALKVFVGLLK